MRDRKTNQSRVFVHNHLILKNKLKQKPAVGQQALFILFS
ncbi:hypothetical protein MuYL_4777 [Mucilaginibacter xinganensis]|uniref:Uncharacterized protein n=1 Tax=Mucilaginibacter xinganensis TaxID=1234841 RepID=A0A223P3N8_9SPHI|nr:hypothetical protein MuYL_4777 [Mucilaginibacter xinganensis]